MWAHGHGHMDKDMNTNSDTDMVFLEGCVVRASFKFLFMIIF